MKTVDFTQHLLSIQTELFRFAFKLTADREEANDLLQETSLKALDNEEKFTPDTMYLFQIISTFYKHIKYATNYPSKKCSHNISHSYYFIAFI